VADPLTSASEARYLLEQATAAAVLPGLTSTEISALLDMAASLTTDTPPATVYTGRDLNRTASLGWQWKANKVSGDFTISLEGGMRFSREQVYAHCVDRAAAFAVGTANVLTSGGGRMGITSIGLTTSLTEAV
jgi:hypothetical protein